MHDVPRWLAFSALAVVMGGCSSSEVDQPPPVDTSPLGGERPVEPLVPSGYDGTTAIPLVILLHGFGASGVANDLVLQLDDYVESRGFIYLRPDGTINSEGRRFWNATDACCDFEGSGVDDVAYISGLIDEARARYVISRVVLIGHSNGGFMSHRFACDRASEIEAFGSIAGSTWDDPEACQPDDVVAALQIHGTLDDTVLFEGSDANRGTFGGYPGAVDTVARWASLNGCSATVQSASSQDFADDLDGPETEVSFHPDCEPGAAAELWAMEGEGHIPAFNDAWRDAVLGWLLDESVAR